MQQKKNDDNFDLTKTELQTGIQKCKDIVISLCHDALLLKNGSTAFGLYLFALEEYGKMLWLEEILEKNENRFFVPKVIFGKGEKKWSAHRLKMNKALAKLPPACKKFSISRIIARNDTMETRTYTINRKEKVTLSSSQEDELIEPVLANLNLRLNCFLTDWDDDLKGWKLSIIQAHSLEKAINEFIKLV